MITPAYGPTSTERVLPKLALDFTTGVLDPRVTVARALNTATRINNSGFIETVNADLPRFDYDPVTLAPRGLLIEEQRQNRYAYSTALDNPIWVQSFVTVGTAPFTAPNGSPTSYVIIPTAGNASFRELQQNTSVTAGTTYCISAYRREKEFRYAQIIGASAAFGTFYVNFDLRTGTETAFSAGTSTVVARGIINCGNGWYRIWAAVTCLATTSSRMSIDIIANANDIRSASFVANGTDGMYAFGDQFEVGAFPTSYIPTATTSLTRNADVVSMTGTNFSDWYNASEGTFTAEASTMQATSAATVATVVSVDDGTTSNRIIHRYLSGNIEQVVISGGAVQTQISQAYTANTVGKLASGFKANSFAMSFNAASPGIDNTGSVPNATRMNIGNLNSALQLNGHICKLAFYKQRFLNAELQAFSK